MEEEHSEPKQSEELATLQQFVTSLWMHPLVLERTKLHRAAMLQQAQEALPQEILEHIALIPIGSTLWIPTASSDFDVRPITRTIQVQSELGRLITHMQSFNFHLHGGTSLEGLTDRPANFDLIISTLLCPDDFIAGNRSLVAQARLMFISQLEHQWYTFWEQPFSIMKRLFDKMIFWDQITIATFEDAERYGFDVVLKNKPERIQSAIREKAKKTGHPRKFREWFENWRNDITLLPFEIYKKAILESEGRLYLDPAFTHHKLPTFGKTRLLQGLLSRLFQMSLIFFFHLQ